MRHKPNRIERFVFIILALTGWLLTGPWLSSTAAAGLIYADQGANWTASKPLQFYSEDQGSRLLPLKWIFALKQADGTPFMADSLARYGYLPNPASNPKGLPVGFTVNGNAFGMTCAAFHTREIEVGGNTYRIDGGPTIADFQSFVADLDSAVGRTLENQGEFDAFAASVFGGAASAAQKRRLRNEVADCYLSYHTIMSIALPKDNPWRPTRLDAVGMIFNRLTGLDIGPGANHIIRSNIRLADTPVR